MLQKTEFIWFDGKLVPLDQAQVHVLAHGLHYGTGVFEGIRAYACPDGSSAVFRLPEHSTRLSLDNPFFYSTRFSFGNPLRNSFLYSSCFSSFFIHI